ncbi:MAG: arginase family protein, partial [Deinococcus sp.]|nr:arginase family protein [Deinococcus sp.]
MARNLDLASYATFCGLRQVPEDFDRARVVFLPVPFDATTSYQGGAKAGPTAILAASVELEMYDEELARETTDLGFFTLPPVAIAAGDPA